MPEAINFEEFDLALEPSPTGSVAETMERIDKAIQAFCAQGAPDQNDIRYVFQTSFECADYMEVFAKRSKILATAYVPATIHAVGTKAIDGNLSAARLLFQLVDLVDSPAAKNLQQPTNVFNNVTVSNPTTLKDWLEQTAEVHAITGEVIDVEVEPVE